MQSLRLVPAECDTLMVYGCCGTLRCVGMTPRALYCACAAIWQFTTQYRSVRHSDQPDKRRHKHPALLEAIRLTLPGRSLPPCWLAPHQRTRVRTDVTLDKRLALVRRRVLLSWAKTLPLSQQYTRTVLCCRRYEHAAGVARSRGG